jgi:hypothetical protein
VPSATNLESEALVAAEADEAFLTHGRVGATARDIQYSQPCDCLRQCVPREFPFFVENFATPARNFNNQISL